ncbi:MAG TPA: 2,3-dihydroxyphenylpropionate 1,2-dioxygenase [Burkholderiales bacterium]|nr:2,3-dihydroxyphenylpropionate 1,2-dioxygenase [Burkholderiales bacterium]
MASFVGAFAASHGPLIIREWERVPAGEQRRLSAAYRELGRRLTAARPDVLMVVSPDHWSNFFLDNYPAVCIGVGETNDGPPEPWMKDFPHRTMAGHPQLGLHIASTALAQGYEPAVSHRLKMDHGSCIPLWRMELERLPKIVPFLVNSIEPPMPSLARCYRWGELLRQAIESYPEALRVAILGTGGLSHSIGEPTMGAIYEDFDRESIRLFGRPADELIQYLDAELPTSGNGSEEIRNWLVAHGAAGGRGFELVDYLPVPTVIVGCGFAAWRA